MRNLLLISFAVLYSCSSTNEQPNIQEGIAYPFMDQYTDTIKTNESLVKTIFLNSETFENYSRQEGLDMTYSIYVNNKTQGLGFEILPTDTMIAIINFDSLNIEPDSAHSWQLLANVKFEKSGEFLRDTTFRFINTVLITK
ncbi:MAG: hypothetical protein RJQ14_00770 [Marinoscillum sp.]